jgi:alpha-methylacyl-CoA racemase
LGLDEVAEHPHNRERGLIIDMQATAQPAPAPRLSRTPGRALKSAGPRGANTREILGGMNYSKEEIEGFIESEIAE